MVSLNNFSIGVLLIVVAAALFPQPTNAAQIRNCGKEIEDDFRKFKQKMRFQGFGRDLNTKKKPEIHSVAGSRAQGSRQARKSPCQGRGPVGEKIIYRYFDYWGEKYAVAGCVPLRSKMPAKKRPGCRLGPGRSLKMGQENRQRRQAGDQP